MVSHEDNESMTGSSWRHSANSLLNLAIKGVFVPIFIPIVAYNLYNRHRHKNLSATRANNSLTGKVVLITGASSGLGEAIAKLLFEFGCKVILAARRRPELERVKRALLDSKQGQPSTDTHTWYTPEILLLDLNDVESMSDRAREAEKLFNQPIDILINNGGISFRGTSLDTSIRVDEQLMRVNYLGPVALTKAFLPQMIERDSGHIVAIGSVQGRIAIPLRSAYAASKHALQAFFDSLRSELVHTQVNVTVINPGYIRTNLSLNALNPDGSTYGRMDETQAHGMPPEEAASEVVYSIIHAEKEVMLSPIAPRLAVVIRSVFPTLFFLLMSNRAKRLLRKEYEIRGIEDMKQFARKKRS